MKNLQRYLIGNLIILVCYTIFCKVLSVTDKAGLGYIIMMMLFVGAHAFTNFVASLIIFIRGDRETGKTLMLCAGVTLVVGFSACLGGASVGKLTG